MKLEQDSTSCPHCGADLIGSPIPEEHRDNYYGGRTHYSRLIGISSLELDRVVAWKCPDCGAEDEREWAR